MPNNKPKTAPSLLMRPGALSRWDNEGGAGPGALSRWDNEGGAGPGGPQQPSSFSKEVGNVSEISNATLAQLQVRVIALENVAVALLAGASNEQLAAIREMADSITQTPDSTQPITLLAAKEMIHLVERAGHFRS